MTTLLSRSCNEISPVQVFVDARQRGKRLVEKHDEHRSSDESRLRQDGKSLYIWQRAPVLTRHRLLPYGALRGPQGLRKSRCREGQKSTLILSDRHTHYTLYIPLMGVTLQVHLYIPLSPRIRPAIRDHITKTCIFPIGAETPNDWLDTQSGFRVLLDYWTLRVADAPMPLDTII